MLPRTTNYLAGYPPGLIEQVQRHIATGEFGARLLQRYPSGHAIRSDKALFDYVQQLKSDHMRNAGQLSKVRFDSTMHAIRNALGTHTTISRVQGTKLRTKREIRIAALFRETPSEFLRMIVVHELAHMKESNHDKVFYQLCQHMEPDYHQFEFELRSYLSYLDAGGQPLWPTVATAN